MQSHSQRMSTPLMKQYSQVKAKYPDTILLFRMGDFFETFDEDAKTTSKVLGITLTKRGNGSSGEVPLAGFPHHALDLYLPKLLKAGYRVAVCEQLEDPKFAKGIVKRDVIEVVTPGVSFSDKVLSQKQNNYLCAVALPSAIASAGDMTGLAFVDVSTAEFSVSEFPLRDLPQHIASLAPSEILVQGRDADAIQSILKQTYGGIFSKLEDWIFNFDYAYELLINHFKTQTLKGFGIEPGRQNEPGGAGGMLAVMAAGAVMNYLQETQKTNLLHIKKIVPYATGDFILLDQATKRNLEIATSSEGREDITLFGILDRTLTPMGGRLLKKWINQPLRKLEPVKSRQEAVSEFVDGSSLRASIAEVLSNIGDLERLMSKICTGRANPREVVALKTMVSHVSRLKGASSSTKCATLRGLSEQLQTLDDLITTISTSIVDDPPLSLADGGVVRKGFNNELDQIREVSLNGKSWIANLQAKEKQRTGVSSLKVGFNNVFGYYIEVTNTHKEKIPPDYIRKQTTVNAERFITPELKEYEDTVLHAEEKIQSLELKIFNDVRLQVAGYAETVQRNAQIIAALDCYVSLAGAAADFAYVRPTIDESERIEILEGRHPVIERLLPPGDQYTPNDVVLDNTSQQILIITGPNMSGKSSYLRQTGLIVLMAQIGSFVPARKAHIGLVDKIFTRVGASDNIASGESTFLVEMHEAAHIANTATPKSLILLDEVGRGTSTFDGISIAWALTEYIHNRIGAKTLFATHYHELNELAELFPRIKNLKVEVREYGEKVIFLHKVAPGFADHSYGIQVAQMAGLPEEVTDRAKKILRNLEGSEISAASAPKGRIVPQEPQMTLFEMKDDKLRNVLLNLEPDKMTPLEAMQKLAEIIRSIQNEK